MSPPGVSLSAWSIITFRGPLLVFRATGSLASQASLKRWNDKELGIVEHC